MTAVTGPGSSPDTVDPTPRSAPWLRVAALFTVVVAAYWRFKGEAARLEALWSVEVAERLGIDGIYAVPGTPLVRGSHAGMPYLVRVTDSCSALTAGAALVGLSLLVLAGPWPRRLLAAAAGVAPLLIGNLLRIVAIVHVGNERGRARLISFHDWWGTIFALGYLFAAFVLVVAVRLPSTRRWRAAAPETYGL